MADRPAPFFRATAYIASLCELSGAGVFLARRRSNAINQLARSALDRVAVDAHAHAPSHAVRDTAQQRRFSTSIEDALPAIKTRVHAPADNS